MGAPTHCDLDKHPKEFIEFSKQGKSKTWIAAIWGIDRKTLYNWSKNPNLPEFVKAYNIGRELCQAWHEDFLHKLITGEMPGGRQAIVGQMYRMKCMFKEDWYENNKQQIEITNTTAQEQGENIDDVINKLLADSAGPK